MKIALYYPWVYLTSGAERTILELTGRSRHSWTIFTNRYEPANTFPGLAQREIVQLDPVPVKRTVGGALAGARRILMQQLPLEDHRALVVVCEGFGDLVLFRNRSLPALCLCLTPLRVAFDPIYRQRSFGARGVLSRNVIRTGAAAFRAVDRLAWKRYRRIIAISREAKDRAVAGGLAAASRIQIAHPGLGFEPPAPSERFDPFFLIPGRMMWTKNLELGIAAFAEFRRRHPQHRHFRLVIAGIVDRKSEGYYRKLRGMAGEGVEFVVHPSDAELARLYRECRATLFTAFNEDWGIVPLESMAFGKPVIAVDRGGPRETVISGRNGFRAEAAPEAFAGHMAELAASEDMARRLGRAGHLDSRRYNWQNFTDCVDDGVDAVVLEQAGPIALPSRARQLATGK